MFLQVTLARRNWCCRTIPTLLGLATLGCSDDGTTPIAPPREAGVDAAVTGDSPDTSVSTSSEQTSIASASDTAASTVTALTSETRDAAASSPPGNSTPDAAGATSTTADGPDADAGDVTIDWSSPPSGVTCVDAEDCVNGLDALGATRTETCAVKSDGSLWCWGAASEFIDGAPVPSKRGELSEVVSVHSAATASCAVKANGSVWCWGYSEAKLFGPSSELVSLGGYWEVYQASEPVQISGLSNVKSIAVGRQHVCAVDETGGVWCWGNNAYGQLGVSDLGSSVAPTHVAGLPKARRITSNGDSTCVVALNGDVYCWGENSRGQLGNGAELPEYAYVYGELSSAAPVKVNISDVTELTSSYDAVCATTSDDVVACWGGLGGVGLGVAPTSVPAVIDDWQGAQAVAIGDAHACAIVADGRVSCVGDGGQGQIGAVAAYPPTSVFVEDVADAVMIAAGGAHTCVVHATGEVSCWGDDVQGQLGDGVVGLSGSDTPLPVASNLPFASVAVGATTCGVTTAGDVSCWGSNRFGELGVSPDALLVSAKPRDMTELDDVSAVSGGEGHLCSLHDDGTVSCWGDNTYGQLGDSEFDEVWSATPIAVQALSGVVAIEASGGFTCALLDGGTVSCWGVNSAGQLGRDVNDVAFDPTPTAVPNVADAVDLVVGMYHACVRHENGDATCWGGNYFRQFGPNTEDPSPPVVVPALAGAESLATSWGYVCRVNDDGTVGCTGTASFGGAAEGDAGAENGAVDNSVVTPIGLTNVASVSPSCALRNDGTIACWDAWFLPPPSFQDAGVNPFVEFPELGAASYLAASSDGSNACAVLDADSSLVCWGDNSFGELGTGEMAWRKEPALVVWPD